MKKIYLLIAIVLCISVKSEAQSWVTCGPGIALGNLSTGVKAIAVSPYDGAIYAGGTFTGPVNYLAKYNPTTDSWQQVSTGINGPVYALTFFKNNLYVGGLFSTAGGVTVNNIASVSAAGAFSSVGVGLNEQVNTLVAADDSSVLYAGGRFSGDFSGTISMLHVGKWNLSSWSACGAGVQAVVNTLAQFNSKMYAGTDNTVTPVYEFNGSAWSTLSGVTSGKVYALATFAGYLYAGGDFQQPYYAAARFNGSAWNSIVTNFSNGIQIRSLKKVGANLYLGGNFTNAGVGGAYYIARIDNPVQPIKAVITANNPGSIPYAIDSKDGYIYLGGNFSTSGYNVIRSSTTIGIEEINEVVESSSIYPNPMTTSSNLNVKLKKHVSNANLTIIDSQGKIVYTNTLSESNSTELNFTINRNEMASGIYYYLLQVDGTSVSSRPFVIE